MPSHRTYKHRLFLWIAVSTLRHIMGAVDPTYPLYPIACILASALLFLVLLTSFIRQSWNLGVAFLCFWLFFETLSDAINSILWSDNYDVKNYVYYDIGTLLAPHPRPSVF